MEGTYGATTSRMLGFARLIGRLPLGWLHALGAAAGWIVYLVSPRYRRSVRANLAQAGLDRAGVRHAAIAAAGRQAFELFRIWTAPPAEGVALVREVVGADLLTTARVAGRGLVMITPHMGCFEVAAHWFAAREPITVLYRPPKLAALEPLMLAGRERPNLRLATTDLAGVRRLMRALRAGESVGLLPDQVPGRGEGEWVEFFGRPAYTMTLANRLSASFDAPMIIAFCERLPRGAGFRLRFSALPDPLPGEAPLRRLNRAIEDLIRSCPEQYLWGYNRYKVPAGAAPATAAAASPADPSAS
jgi:KDO2-lipid IV(A) lauroyltransferase